VSGDGGPSARSSAGRLTISSKFQKSFTNFFKSHEITNTTTMSFRGAPRGRGTGANFGGGRGGGGFGGRGGRGGFQQRDNGPPDAVLGKNSQLIV